MSSAPVLVVEANSGLGGPPITLLEIVSELSRRRRVVVAIRPGPIERALRERAPDATVVPLPSWTKHRRWLVRLRSLPALRRALTHAGSSAIVHANGKSALNLVGPLLVGQRRRAVFVHFHDSELTSRTASQLRAWRRLGIQARYSAVSCMSSDVLRDAGLGSSLLPELPNPVRPLPSPSRSERNAGSPFRVVWGGSRRHRKGLDLALEVVAAMGQHDVELDIFGVVGDSPFLADCRSLVARHGLEKRVRWLGRQPDFATRLAEYDAALVTSRQESFCRVAVEAMAAGVPVAAGRIEGLEEAVGEGNCRLFDLGDASAGAEAVRALRSPETWLALHRRGLKRAAEFTPARVCDLLEERYAALDRR